MTIQFKHLAFVNSRFNNFKKSLIVRQKKSPQIRLKKKHWTKQIDCDNKISLITTRWQIKKKIIQPEKKKMPTLCGVWKKKKSRLYVRVSRDYFASNGYWSPLEGRWITKKLVCVCVCVCMKRGAGSGGRARARV